MTDQLRKDLEDEQEADAYWAIWKELEVDSDWQDKPRLQQHKEAMRRLKKMKEGKDE